MSKGNKLPSDFVPVLREIKEEGKYKYFKFISDNSADGVESFRHSKHDTFYHVVEWLGKDPSRMGLTDKRGNEITVQELIIAKKRRFRFCF